MLFLRSLNFTTVSMQRAIDFLNLRARPIMQFWLRIVKEHLLAASMSTFSIRTAHLACCLSQPLASEEVLDAP